MNDRVFVFSSVLFSIRNSFFSFIFSFAISLTFGIILPLFYSQSISAKPILPLEEHYLTEQGIMGKVYQLEKRIKAADSEYQPFSNQIPEPLLSNFGAVTYLLPTTQEIYLALIPVKERANSHAIERIFLFIDPMTNLASSYNSPFDMNATPIYKFSMLERLFNRAAMKNIIGPSFRSFVFPQSDFFAQAYVASYLRLQGYEDIKFEDRMKGAYPVRELSVGKRRRFENAPIQLPSYETVQAQVDVIIDHVIDAEVRNPDLLQNKTHYEVSVLIYDMLNISSASSCMQLF